MEELIKIIFIILISSVKFVVAPPFAAFYNPDVSLTYFQAVITCIAGGMLGVFVFTYFSPYVFKMLHAVQISFINLFKKRNPDGSFSSHVIAKRKLFTPHNRRIVHIWKKYGLIGITFLSPLIISIPIGAIVAAKLVHDKKKIFLYMFIAITFWSLVMNSFYYFNQEKRGVVKAKIESADK
jgi:uncharacterized membrane protein YfcA